MRCAVVDLEDLRCPDGAVVVIDVLRACTTAAAAVAAGATGVVVAGTVADAVALGERCGAPVAGEVGGFPVPGFDYTNSPVDVAAADLSGRSLVLRTTAGTQGLLRARGAATVLAAGFVTASATVAALRATAPEAGVTLVVTGSHSADRGEEDRALADYLAARLAGGRPAPEPYLARARASAAARRFAPGGDLADHGADLEACLALDRYDFALRLAAGDPPRLVPLPREQRRKPASQPSLVVHDRRVNRQTGCHGDPRDQA